MKFSIACAAAFAAAAFAVAPQDDMKEIKAAIADLKASVDAMDKKIDAMAKDMKEITEAVRQGREAAGQIYVSRTKSLIRQIETACETYEKEQNKYPSDAPGELVKALAEPGPRGVPYVNESITKTFVKDGNLIDPWGNPIKYQRNDVIPPPDQVRNTGRIDLYSFGPNGKDDGGDGDDINNWK